LVSDFSPLRLLFGAHSIQVSFLLGVLGRESVGKEILGKKRIVGIVITPLAR